MANKSRRDTRQQTEFEIGALLKFAFKGVLANVDSGPGPGGGAANGDAGIGEGADMVEVVVGSVRMRYPSCYVLACDADNVANSAAFNQLAALEGGQSG